MKGDVLALPFDQYQRYRLAADVLRQLRGGGPQLAVLDVGGRTAVLREFLTDARITLVDIDPSDEPGLVLGDGARLPFKDASFDAVCAFDTLEHVPPRFREAFVAECRRVARRWVLLVGPYDDARVAQAEQLLQRFLAEKLGEAHRYLGEHLANGLPDMARTERQLRALGARTLSLGHGNLDRWLVLQCMSMYMDYDPALRELGHDFQRFYNAALYASDHAEPVYRHVLVGAFGDAPLPRKEGLLGPAVAPQGALKQGFDLAAELVHFDRERAAWRKEREALRTAARVLEQDLAGHRSALTEQEQSRARARADFESVRAELQRDLEGHRAELAAVRAQLDGHRKSLSDARQQIDELHKVRGHTEREYRAVLVDRDAHAARADEQRAAAEQLRTELLQERSAGALVRRELESELAGHRQSLATLRADLDGHRKLADDLRGEARRLATEAAALRSHADALSAERATLRVHSQTLSKELGGERAHAANLGRELEGQRAHAANLERELATQRAHAATLAADLDGHRAALANLQADLDGHRKANAEQSARIERLTLDYGALAAAHREMEAELQAERARRAEVEAALARSDAELRKTLAFASGIEDSLAQREIVYDELRAELRSRWRNFARVFRPKP